MTSAWILASMMSLGGMESGAATMPAASDHEGGQGPGLALDLTFRTVIGQIFEVTKTGSTSQLEWFKKKAPTLELGLDGRWIQPLRPGLGVAGGLWTQVYGQFSGSQPAGGGALKAQSGGGKDSSVNFEFLWNAYAVATQNLGPFRLHGGSLFGNFAQWTSVLSDDLLLFPDGWMGAAPFVGADVRLDSKRRIRAELLLPMGYEEPPLLAFLKVDRLFYFNVGYLASKEGFALIGYVDQRFGLIPKPEEEEKTDQSAGTGGAVDGDKPAAGPAAAGEEEARPAGEGEEAGKTIVGEKEAAGPAGAGDEAGKPTPLGDEAANTAPPGNEAEDTPQAGEGAKADNSQSPANGPTPAPEETAQEQASPEAAP